jgi:hypothetical protein
MLRRGSSTLSESDLVRAKAGGRGGEEVATYVTPTSLLMLAFRGAYVMPGGVDAHVHLAQDFTSGEHDPWAKAIRVIVTATVRVLTTQAREASPASAPTIS